MLEFKAGRPAGPDAGRDTACELERLNSVVGSVGPLSPAVEAKWMELRVTRERLWEIATEIRSCDADAPLARLAREERKLNDERTRIRRDIDQVMVWCCPVTCPSNRVLRTRDVASERGPYLRPKRPSGLEHRRVAARIGLKRLRAFSGGG